MAKRLILIPPSEGKAPGGETSPPASREIGCGSLTRLETHTIDEILGCRKEVIGGLGAFLSSASEASASKVLGARGETLERAILADKCVDSGALLPAIERYDGVLYQHLDHSSLDGWARRRLNSSVVVVSGLWGLVTPEELIPDYRLKMSAVLPGPGRLSAFWKPVLTPAVERLSDGFEIWNLLPQEHAAAVEMPGRKVVTSAVFLEPNKSGELVAVNHWNKAHKGTLVRHLVQNPDLRPVDLLDWDHPGGFRLDPDSVEPVGRRRILRFIAP
jgi:cytoplasmic iron level regulating protein YaaA (DUF328/UPF0246 family)